MSDLGEIAAEERRMYMRAWRAANKERVKSYNEKYWHKKAKERVSEKYENKKTD